MADADDGANILLHPSGRAGEDVEERPGPIRVLAVDDDPEYLRYISRLFRKLGFEITTVPSSEAASDRVGTDDYDLLLIDLKAPRAGRLRLLDRIRSNDLLAELLAEDDEEDEKSSGSPELPARTPERLQSSQKILREQNRRLYEHAVTDELTGLPTRHFFEEQVTELLKSKARMLNFVLFDLDHFGEINTRYGDLAGERILTDIGDIFCKGTRFGDLVARYGEDEFIMMIPQRTLAEAKSVAARLVERISQQQWTLNTATFSVSATTGVVNTQQMPHGTLDEILEACERDLDRKKRSREV